MDTNCLGGVVVPGSGFVGSRVSFFGFWAVILNGFTGDTLCFDFRA